MPRRPVWSMTPRQSVEALCARRGRRAVIDGSARLLLGEQADAGLVRALGGPAAERFLDGRPREDVYWLRVWGARGLLWAWDDSALQAVLAALDDESWRVREMALKVIARHLLGDALEAAARLLEDSVPRVRAAAHRAVALLTNAGA